MYIYIYNHLHLHSILSSRHLHLLFNFESPFHKDLTTSSPGGDENPSLPQHRRSPWDDDLLRSLQNRQVSLQRNHVKTPEKKKLPQNIPKTTKNLTQVTLNGTCSTIGTCGAARYLGLIYQNLRSGMSQLQYFFGGQQLKPV